MINHQSSIEENGGKLAAKGAIDLAKIVTSTMGPNGRLAAINFKGAHPYTSKDGKNVAYSIFPENEAERIGAFILREGANRTANDAGDATTTTCQIASNILENWPEDEKIRVVCDELDQALNAVVSVATLTSKIVNEDDVESLVKIATTSANNNAEIGRIVGELVSKVGKTGVVYIDTDPKSDKTVAEVRKGYNMTKGVFSKHLLRQTVDNVFNTAVFVTEDVINESRKIQPILESYIEHYRDKKTETYSSPLVIVASGFSDSALQVVVKNAQMGMPVTAIQADSFEALQDIAVITESFLFGEARGFPTFKMRERDRHFTKAKKEGDLPSFGFSPKVVISASYSTVYFEESARVQAHVDALVDSPERRAKLTRGIGQIMVGGAIDSERTDIAQLIEDAEQSCFAALRTGCLPGGGVFFYAMAESMNVEDTGSALLATAMKSVFQKLCENSEVDHEGDYIREGQVFNFKSMQFEPVETTSVVDSTQAVISALTNAVAVVKQIVNIKYSIVNND